MQCLQNPDDAEFHETRPPPHPNPGESLRSLKRKSLRKKIFRNLQILRNSGAFWEISGKAPGNSEIPWESFKKNWEKNWEKNSPLKKFPLFFRTIPNSPNTPKYPKDLLEGPAEAPAESMKSKTKF